MDATAAPLPPAAAQQQLAASQELLYDVFRRMDKNDDNLITQDEFCTFFKDYGVGHSRLQEIFASIDKDRNGFLDVQELFAFFVTPGRIANYAAVFGGLAQLNAAVAQSLNATAQVYRQFDDIDQFVARFFISEIVGQLPMVGTPLQLAYQRLQDDARPASDAQTVAMDTADPSLPAQAAAGPGHHYDLQAQVNRLAELVNALGGQLQLALPARAPPTSASLGEPMNPCPYVQTRVPLFHDSASSFSQLTRDYFVGLKKEPGFIHADLFEDPASTAADPVAVVATLWRSTSAVEAHHRSQLFRQYRQATTALVSGLESTSHSTLPASWIGRLHHA